MQLFLEKHPKKLLASNFILLKLGSSNVSPQILFVEICRSFRITSKELVLEDYVLEYHTADNDHNEIL